MSAQTAGKRTRREAPALNRTVVVDRALDIADVEGIDAVTIRRMAGEFDVTPMALYWHFKNFDEMRAALGDRLIELVEPPSAATSGEEYLRALLAAVIESLRRHPAAAPIVPERILACDKGIDLTEQVLSRLLDDGYSPAAATTIARNALQTGVALVVGLPGAEVATPADERERTLREKRARLLSLPEDRYPNVRRMADEMLACDDPDDYYTAGVDLFIDGIGALRDR